MPLRKKLLLSRMLNEICLNGPKDKNHHRIKVAVVAEAEDVVIEAAEEVEIVVVIRDRIVDKTTQDPNMDRRTQIYKVGNIIIQELFDSYFRRLKENVIKKEKAASFPLKSNLLYFVLSNENEHLKVCRVVVIVADSNVAHSTAEDTYIYYFLRIQFYQRADM